MDIPTSTQNNFAKINTCNRLSTNVQNKCMSQTDCGVQLVNDSKIKSHPHVHYSFLVFLRLVSITSSNIVTDTTARPAKVLESRASDRELNWRIPPACTQRKL